MFIAGWELAQLHIDQCDALPDPADCDFLTKYSLPVQATTAHQARQSPTRTLTCAPRVTTAWPTPPPPPAVTLASTRMSWGGTPAKSALKVQMVFLQTLMLCA